MSKDLYFCNPHFREYVRLLHELHVRVGADESEAENLRSLMDVPGELLAEEEVQVVNAISADFYTLADPPWTAEPMTPQAQADLKNAIEAQHRGDFVKALDLLRKNQISHDPAMLAFFRGCIWFRAGEFDVAADFFHRARELDSQQANCALQWLG